MEVSYQVIENDAELDSIVDKMLSVANEDPVDWNAVNSEVAEKFPLEELENASLGELSKKRIDTLKRFSEFIAFGLTEDRAYQVTFSITEDTGLLSIINGRRHPLKHEDVERVVKSFSRYGNKIKEGIFVPHVRFLRFEMRH